MRFSYLTVYLFVILSQFIPIPSYSEDIISGVGYDDSIRGTPEADVLIGGKGNDKLYGDDGADELRGGVGDDVLEGGKGADRLYGGLGADQFVLDLDATEMDEIYDFNPEEGDTIVLQWSEKTPRKLTFDKIEINYKGDVKVNLGDSNWKNIVNLKQGHLTFKVEQKGSRAYLRFGGKF